jgi:hypothetical protein
VKRVKRFANQSAIVSLCVVTLTMGLIYCMSPDLYQDPVFLSAAGLLLIVTMISIRKARAASHLHVLDEVSAGGTFGHILGQSGLMAVLLPTYVMAGCASVALSLALGVIEFLTVLQNGPDPTVTLPSVAVSMQQIFQCHLMASLGFAGLMGITWLIFGCVFVRLCPGRTITVNNDEVTPEAMTKKRMKTFLFVCVFLSFSIALLPAGEALVGSLHMFLEDNSDGDGIIISVVMGGGILAAGGLLALFGILISYCIFARVFRIPRSMVEEMNEELARQNSPEGRDYVQGHGRWSFERAFDKYDLWCLDRVYGKKL